MKTGLFGLFIALSVMLVRPPVSSSQDEILIGLVPEENIFKQMERHRPLAEYLSGRLGMKVRLTILSKYGDVIDKFTSRKMDGGFFEVFTAVLAMEKLSLEPVARPVSLAGSSTTQSYIFVRRDSNIKNVQDLKGKRMAFVDRATVTGYLFAIAYLREHGVTDIGRFFSEYYYTGSHDSAIYSVLDNRADVGTAERRVFEGMITKDPVIKRELDVIARSRELPDTTLCIRADLPGEIKAKIKAILLTMDREPGGQEVLRKFGALKFVEANKKDFLPFFDVAKKAGVNIRDYHYK